MASISLASSAAFLTQAPSFWVYIGESCAADGDARLGIRLEHVAGDQHGNFVADLLGRPRRDEQIDRVGGGAAVRRDVDRGGRLGQREADLLAAGRRRIGAPVAVLAEQGRLRGRIGRRLGRLRRRGRRQQAATAAAVTAAATGSGASRFGVSLIGPLASGGRTRPPVGASISEKRAKSAMGRTRLSQPRQAFGIGPRAALCENPYGTWKLRP